MKKNDNNAREAAEHIPDNLLQKLEQIQEIHNDTFRQCRIMLAGFMSVKEKDIAYMDRFMDPLFDFMEQGSDAEFLYRKYLTYLAKLDPEESRKRFAELEDEMGYWAPAVYAAAFVARELHAGQVDKGGEDYFRAHLLKVGGAGRGWKEKITGFLHDAAEDTGHDVEEVICMTGNTLKEWAEHLRERPWEGLFDWETELLIGEYPGSSVFFPTDEDWAQIAEALTLLNHHTCADREEYIQRIKTNPLALRVKLEDLRSNMDLSRIPDPTRKDYDRLQRYKREYAELLEYFRLTYGDVR